MFDTPRLQLMLRGVQRTNPPSRHANLAVSVSNLEKLCAYARCGLVIIWAVCCVHCVPLQAAGSRPNYCALLIGLFFFKKNCSLIE